MSKKSTSTDHATNCDCDCGHNETGAFYGEFNKFMSICFDVAKSKGWHEKPAKSPLEFHALFHSEISEATESVRNREKPFFRSEPNMKPEGEVAELADVIIRIADYCASLHYDLAGAIVEKVAYNMSREYRHGNKKY